MKKGFFLFWGFFFLHTVFLHAQVRIGGIKEPHRSALLDLNETNDANDGKQGLALPRVVLNSHTTQLNGNNPPDGMIVYNTNKAFGEGIYYWVSNKWVKVASGSFIEGDAIVGNEVTGATHDGGLKRDGAGTAADPYTLGIDKGGVTNKMIAAGAVTGDKIDRMSASKNDVLSYDGSHWRPQPVDSLVKAAGSGSGVKTQFYSKAETTFNGSYTIAFKEKVVLPKTIFILNGHQGKERLPLSMSELTNISVRIPAASSSRTGFSLQVIEFN
ncbi:MAG: hypothetical protein LBU22_11635 [Dysgonamonadaceae bacterium]|jgi:hypothetical protein|nr:hypothetical protein [Dysgonamonadaceae bacterium]